MPNDSKHSINQQIAQALNVQTAQVSATVNLIDEGSTIPFIARYRKEVTGGLDDTQLRTLDSRLTYLRELESRRQVILKSIREQDKLTSTLAQEIAQAESKTRLEDLYLPYKPKRRTKGQIAIEAGLAPLAERLWLGQSDEPERTAAAFVDKTKGIPDSKGALDGARAIIAEQIAEQANLLDRLRRYLNKNAFVTANVVKGQAEAGEKFKDYFSYSEKISKVPSHRALAILRGRNEGFLQIAMQADHQSENRAQPTHCETLISQYYNLHLSNTPIDRWRQQTIHWTWRNKLHKSMENEQLANMKEQAEIEAINVFANNLTDLLMASPAGPRITLGLDPGLRTGCKAAVIDSTGKLIATDTIYPHQPQRQIDQAEHVIEQLIRKHKVALIAIGNGTASRETDRFIETLLKRTGLDTQRVIVSEAGASVYSASALAAQEFPDLDVSLRGAVSIARRLQDPLAELVKIDPQSIGVGQYQHDVSQSLLTKRLEAVVEDCVNAVGVDVNTASPALLTQVAGLTNTIAQNIVAHRDQQGRFESRSALKKVARLGPKAFEQCAGFLRIMAGNNPLDASAVHPESYAAVEVIAHKNGRPIKDLIGDSHFLNQLNALDYTSDKFGLPTMTDIIKELDKPGRDPRPEFKTATFTEGVNKISDLEAGMILEGVVSNVANFGAFVDIGVHQDGLVHISALTDRFVSDPREVVKAGDIVQVKVIDVEIQRKRIALTMRLDDSTNTRRQPSKPKPTQNKASTANKSVGQRSNRDHTRDNQGAMGGAFASAFAKAKK